jgi:antitoxin component YwqK of YwqJK toxin-antitoxin module
LSAASDGEDFLWAKNCIFDLQSNLNEVKFILFLFLPLLTYSQRDTTVKGVHYSWVKYDLNWNPYEIGESYDNGIRNGNWIFHDYQGNLALEAHYINDTLNGAAKLYTYLNYPTTVKEEGLYVNGYKTGRWVVKERERVYKRWKTIVVLLYDQTERLVSKAITFSNGVPKIEIFYAPNGEEAFYRFYKRCGKMIRETKEDPWVTVIL